MTPKNIAILVCLLVAACGDAQDDGAAAPQPTAYAQMNKAQRATFMSTVVLPQMTPMFAAFDDMKDPEHARWSQFMIGKVWPKMADLLQVDKFDPAAHPSGFSCHNCHTLTGL